MKCICTHLYVETPERGCLLLRYPCGLSADGACCRREGGLGSTCATEERLPLCHLGRRGRTGFARRHVLGPGGTFLGTCGCALPAAHTELWRPEDDVRCPSSLPKRPAAARCPLCVFLPDHRSASDATTHGQSPRAPCFVAASPGKAVLNPEIMRCLQPIALPGLTLCMRESAR